MKAILYARFSPRPNAKECESIEIQQETCRRYCADKGWEIAGEFSDAAKSGGDTDREGLWSAIAALKRGHVLVVQYLDRVARSTIDSIMIEQEVMKKGARIVSVSGEGTWGDSPHDRLVRGICRVLAQYQREITAERTAAAMKRHQANGKRMGDRIPYGFKEGPDEIKESGEAVRTIIPDADEQAIIPKILELHAQGIGLRAIGRTLTEEGLSCRGNGWHHSTIKNIIDRAHNP